MANDERSRQRATIRLCDDAMLAIPHAAHEYPVGRTIRTNKVNYRTCPGHRAQ
jgi:hypothetical protein